MRPGGRRGGGFRALGGAAPRQIPLRGEAADTEEGRLHDEVTRLGREHGEAEAALAGLIASPAYRDLRARLARRDHVASLEAQSRTLAGRRDAAEKRARQAVDRITANRSRLDSDPTRVGDGLRATDRHARAATARIPLPDPPVLRTHALAAEWRNLTATHWPTSMWAPRLTPCGPGASRSSTSPTD